MVSAAREAAGRPRRLQAVPIDTGSGPPLLLVHGQPGSGADWAGVAELLSGSFRVLAPDRPGWGAHPRPATTLAGNASALERMLAAKDVTAERGVIVVGHSLGGGIALELALSRPGLVRVLVLVGSVGVRSALTSLDRLLAVPLVGDGVLRAGRAALSRAARTAGRLSRLSSVERAVERAARLPAVRAVMAEGDRTMDGRDRRSFLVEQRALIEETPGIERRLPTLRLPVAVLQGAADHIVRPSAAADLAGAIPGAELVLRERAGHRLPFEQPDLVAEVVRRYAALGRLVGSSRAG